MNEKERNGLWEMAYDKTITTDNPFAMATIKMLQAGYPTEKIIETLIDRGMATHTKLVNVIINFPAQYFNRDIIFEPNVPTTTKI